jgi:hypothetical protein
LSGSVLAHPLLAAGSAEDLSGACSLSVAEVYEDAVKEVQDGFYQHAEFLTTIDDLPLVEGV